MRIIEICLRNFRGVEYLNVELNGRSATIYGDNGSGKTTINDAFCWLLFGGPSTGEKYWTPKTEGTHNERHLAEMTIEKNGEYIVLRKVYHEVYKEKKGNLEPLFEGHTTDHYVNGMFLTEKQYKAEVEKIVSPKLGRLLSQVGHFAGEMAMKDRRKILMDLFSNVSDKNVVDSDEQLADLEGFHSDIIEQKLATAKRQLSSLDKRLKEAVIERKVYESITGKIEALIYVNTAATKKVVNLINDDYKDINEQIIDLKFQMSNLEMDIYTYERFIKTKVRMITDAINSHFDGMYFRMFDEQVNGEHKEDCELMVDCGEAVVPYKSLNTGAKINAGLKVIDVLSKALGREMPVFVDNAESVSNLYHIKGKQIIRLVVSDSHPEIFVNRHER